MPLIVERPVVSSISDVIFSRLESLVYVPNDAFTFAGVVRPKRLETYTPKHALIVLTRGDVVRVTELDCPGNPPAIAYQQTFLIRVHLAPSEKDETPIERFEDVAEAEIHKAIRTNDTWYSMGGYAIDAEFGALQTVVSDGGYDGISVPLAVTYRVAEGNPYVARS